MHDKQKFLGEISSNKTVMFVSDEKKLKMSSLTSIIIVLQLIKLSTEYQITFLKQSVR